MARSRLLTAAAGLAASLLLSAIAFLVFDTLLLFLFVPFVPFLVSRRRERSPPRECPACGFRTRSAEYEYCPRDGRTLKEVDTGS